MQWDGIFTLTTLKGIERSGRGQTGLNLCRMYAFHLYIALRANIGQLSVNKVGIITSGSFRPVSILTMQFSTSILASLEFPGVSNADVPHVLKYRCPCTAT